MWGSGQLEVLGFVLDLKQRFNSVLIAEYPLREPLREFLRVVDSLWRFGKAQRRRCVLRG